VHAHAHGRHGHGHSHAAPPDTTARRLAIALGLIASYMLAEVVVGIVASSLALLSDAAHMLTDAAALALSLVAIRLARRPAKGALTFGLKRAEVLSAQVNGLTLLILGVLIMVEGVRRLGNPPDVEGGLVLIVAVVGIAVNIAAAIVLSGGGPRSLNVEGAFQHVLNDLYASIGTVAAAAVILTTGFDRADAIASLLVAALMLRSAYSLLKASGRVFLEASPEGIDPEAVGRALAAGPGVVEVHDLHIWEVTSGFPALSAHVVVGRDADCHDARRRMEAVLHDRFGIDHTTLQVDHEGGLLALEVADGLAERPR